MARQPTPYIFVLGLAHSGSTLLGFLLNSHPHVASPGEVALVPEVVGRGFREAKGRCSCGRGYVDCPRWRGSLARMAAAGEALGPFTSDRRRTRGGANRRLAAFSAGYLAEAGATVLADTSKHPEHLESLAGSSAFDVTVIDLRRDGRGVLHSWAPNNTHLSAERLVEVWKQATRRRDAALERIRVPVHRMAYEDLARGPVPEMRRLANAIGIEPVGIDVAGYGDVEHHIIGNPMRLAAGGAVALDERWRSETSQELHDAFETGGGPELNRRSGYS